jgi:hypothetical protein
MNTYQLVASLVGSLAWPVAALVILFFLRRPLAVMLKGGRLKIVKAGPSGVELEYFDEKIEEARRELSRTSDLTSPTPPAPGPRPGSMNELKLRANAELLAMQIDADFLVEMHQLIELKPAAAVISSFKRLTDLLRVIIKIKDPESAKENSYISAMELARRALTLGVITQPEMSAIEELAEGRNIVLRGRSRAIDEKRAIAYTAIVYGLLKSITDRMAISSVPD